MDALSRQEYPAMLERLHPAAAVSKLNERVKRIGKVNSEIADWLLERRKVEEAYVSGLKKLARKPLQEVGGDLGIFEVPWKNIVAATEEFAKSHYLLADRIDKDVEQPLRNFSANNREMTGMSTIQGNLAAMAKEVDEAQEKSDKLSRKGGKANAAKVDHAATRLQSANSQWESQAPFIFETLQALDERRLNHLRDILTQYETLESDQIERNRKTVETTLSSLLEVDTAVEIKTWAEAQVAGKPITERRARQLSSTGSASIASPGTSIMPPPTARSSHTAHTQHTDNYSEHSGGHEKESGLKRFGTMLSRRRQSVAGGFNRAPSPSKGFGQFGRMSSRDGRPSPSPRASSNNLHESSGENRLSSLAESPPPLSPTATAHTNGTSNENHDVAQPRSSSGVNGTGGALFPDLSDVQPPPGPPPSQLKAESRTDSEGFTVPAAMNDPISLAQQDAAQESEQPQFKLDIRNEPILEQDADAQAALSNVANTLRSAQLAPNRKVGTTRGRRDVRNTIYVPPPNSLEVSQPIDTPPMPVSPGIATGRAAALAALSTNDHAIPSGSDTISIRSGHSLTSHALVKHAEMHQPGLNASIIETVHATFENGIVKSTTIRGEIALIHNNDESEIPSSQTTIRINSFPNLEVIAPNRTYIHPVSADKPDEFTLDLSSISSKPSGAFTYRVHIDEENLAAHSPLLLKQTWKTQKGNLLLVIEYSLNPECGAESITLNNLAIIAHYQGTRATTCQTKPSGIHARARPLVHWQLGDVTLTSESHKVICKLGGIEGACPEAGHIEARWEINNPIGTSIGSGITLSRLEPGKGKEKEKEESDDPFADETMPTTPTVPTFGEWHDIAMNMKFVAGKYEAKNV